MIKKNISLFLSMAILLSFPVVSFANVDNYKENDEVIEVQNNKYYYVNERGTTESKTTTISASQARD